jgi:hypothetical protein
MARSKEMQSIAAALGLPAGDGDAFEVVRDGVKVVLDTVTNSGTIVGMSLIARRPDARPPPGPRFAGPHGDAAHRLIGPPVGSSLIVFRREDDEDRSAKARGINVEAQTGDGRFDAFVYIETDLPEAAVNKALQAAEARAAVVRILEVCENVTVDAEGVRATSSSIFKSPDRAAALVADVATLARVARPAHLPAQALLPRTGLGTMFLAALAPLVTGGWCAPAFLVWPPASPVLPLLGLVGGVLLCAPGWMLITGLVRGHSRANRYRKYIILFVCAALPPFGIGMAVTVNGAFDFARQHQRPGKVVAATHFTDSEGPDFWQATVRWRDGEVEGGVKVKDTGPLKSGDDVKQTYGSGAFGFAWGVETVPAPSRRR